MAIQTYINPVTKEKLKLQAVSSMLMIDGIDSEWETAYESGELSSLIVTASGVEIYPYRGFHLDVDTRRVDCEDEIDVDLAYHLPPFINVSVLFGVNADYGSVSIGPHMNDDMNLFLSRQFKEILNKKPELSERKIHQMIPLSLCMKEPNILSISPDHLMRDENDLTNAIKIISTYAKKGNDCWPVSMCIEPIPYGSIHETLTCRNKWTKKLGQSWFEIEYLVSKFCPEASLGGRFSKLVNMCLWLYQWTEAMNIGSVEENDQNGGTIDALRIIQNEWRAWSKLYELNNCVYKDMPNWSERDVDLLSDVLANPLVHSLKKCFNKRRLTDEHQAILSALSTQYRVSHNPIAVAGTELARTVLDKIDHPSQALWCLETKIEKHDDGFIAISNCGEIFAKNKKEDTLVSKRCDYCDIKVGKINIKSIYDRQQIIDECIGTEQRFGRTSHSDCKDIHELWSLSGTRLYIIDRYLDQSTIPQLEKVPKTIPIQILISDDDPAGVNRLKALLIAINKSSVKGRIEIKVVSCKRGPSSHPLHDRYVFSDDWGASLSSSLNALNSNALWVFKIDDYQKLKMKYFDFFWNLPLDIPIDYGPREITVRQISI